MRADFHHDIGSDRKHSLFHTNSIKDKPERIAIDCNNVKPYDLPHVPQNRRNLIGQFCSIHK